MRRTALALTFALLSSAALAQQVNDVQLRPGSSSLWGAQFNQNNNQVIDQFNTAGSTVDSFRWFQGTSVPAGTFLWSLSTTGHIAGPATGGRMGAGTINAVGYYQNGIIFGGTPGGTNGQVQYNNAGVFGGFTTSGDATINTGTGALTLATVNANVGTFGSATTCITTTQNAKGLTTAISAATCTPALGSITGFGTGVAAALAINIGSAGAPVLFNGAGGTPSSLALANATGLLVAGGGTGRASNTANAIMAAGTTGTGAQQQLGLGTTTQVLHGNAAGLATFGAVVSADMNITTTGCTNQFVTAISANGVGTCTTSTLASAQHANQGTTTTVLHGNAAGNPSFGAVSLATDVTSNLPTANATIVPSFSVHKGGTSQTGIVDATFTKLTWPTEVYDVGNFFTSDQWTPPAGKITLTAAAYNTGTWSAGALLAIAIYKDAAPFKQGNWYAAAANAGATSIAVEDVATGSNVYSVYIYIDVSASTGTVDGQAVNTYFMGHWFSP